MSYALIIEQDLRIIYTNFQIDILSYAVEIHKKLNRQNSLFHPECEVQYIKGGSV